VEESKEASRDGGASRTPLECGGKRSATPLFGCEESKAASRDGGASRTPFGVRRQAQRDAAFGLRRRIQSGVARRRCKPDPFGVRRQAQRDAAFRLQRRIQSGVALRLPPHSKGVTVWRLYVWKARMNNEP